MRRINKGIAAITLAGAAFASTATAAQATASPNRGALVNVFVVNLLNGNSTTVLKNVEIPVAATVCDVDVNVLSKQLKHGAALCKALSNAKQYSWVSTAHKK